MAEAAPTPLLALTGISKSFRAGVEALAGIDLAVSSGAFLSLLGPSGCGKSTLLRIIAGLVRPSRGEVRLGDSELRHRTGFVFQEPTLMPVSDQELLMQVESSLSREVPEALAPSDVITQELAEASQKNSNNEKGERK